jgi:hypothetical protein
MKDNTWSRPIFVDFNHEVFREFNFVQVGVVKIYVAAAKALRKKERHDETQFTTKIGERPILVPS